MLSEDDMDIPDAIIARVFPADWVLHPHPQMDKLVELVVKIAFKCFHDFVIEYVLLLLTSRMYLT